MRVLGYVCDHHLEASDDEELFEKARAHIDQGHSGLQLTDEEVRDLVFDRAYD